MSRQSLDLITNGSATGPGIVWGGGDGVFSVAGTFSGATVALQYLAPDAVTWVNAGIDTTLTAVGGGVASLPSGKVRAVVTGGPPSGIYAKLTSLA